MNFDEVEASLGKEEVKKADKVEKKLEKQVAGKKKLLSQCSEGELKRHVIVLQAIVTLQWLAIFAAA